MSRKTEQRLETLVRILADGEFHSGEALAQKIGVSRTAVWKLIKKIQEWQLTVYSVRGRGYQVPGGIELLEQGQIIADLAEAGTRFQHIDVLTTTPSTADFVARQWREYPGESRVCVAEHQSQGRGRKGRAWVSPFAANLYFSVGIELPLGLSALGGLSLAAGINMARVLNQLTVEPVKLKWPNDLLLDGRKLAGILVEASGDSVDKSFLNIGVGINWSMAHEQAESIDQPWANLQSALAEPTSRHEVLCLLLIALDRALSQYLTSGFSQFEQHWPNLSAYYGKDVQLHLPQRQVKGREVGVEANGALRVDTGKGVEVFHSGEISLRAGARGASRRS